MNFFKKLFGKKTVPAVKEVPNVKPVGSQEKKSPRSKPMEVQEKVTPSIEPIIMQAVKSLFPNIDVQEKAIKYIESLDWYFFGGSYFDSTGKVGKGFAQVA